MWIRNFRGTWEIAGVAELGRSSYCSLIPIQMTFIYPLNRYFRNLIYLFTLIVGEYLVIKSYQA